MPEYPSNANYPTTPDQYATHTAERDVNASMLHHYAVRPVEREGWPYAHGVFRVKPEPGMAADAEGAKGVKVALYETYEQATYVANALNDYAGSEIQ